MRVVMVDPGAFTPFHDDALCRALAEQGCTVELATAPFAYHRWPEAAGYTRRELFPAGSGGALAERSALRRAARRLRRAATYPARWLAFVAELERRPPQVVHLQWSLLPRLERRALARLRARGLAIVQTVHNPAPRVGERSWRAGPELLLDGSDAVVALSEATGRALRARHPGVEGKVRVIPPGIARHPTVDRESARCGLGLDSATPVALFLGLIKPYKGVDLLLEAFAAVAAELPGARLVIAGLPKMPWEPLQRLIERLGIGERVRADLRYLPQETLDGYLAAADLVVLPYRDGSQSAVLGAALAAGRPVLVSAVGGLREMLPEDAEALVVPPGDRPALARAMTSLLADRGRAEALGQRCGAAARRRYSWPAAAAATLALYGELSAVRGRS